LNSLLSETAMEIAAQLSILIFDPEVAVFMDSGGSHSIAMAQLLVRKKLSANLENWQRLYRKWFGLH